MQVKLILRDGSSVVGTVVQKDSLFIVIRDPFSKDITFVPVCMVNEQYERIKNGEYVKKSN